ncbi:MAG: type II toxin-antitoxin system HicA family toxin [Oscillospiraceae bacterium]|jgi:predicted RNA binding protein YcfA (HicA-like mRNA interferase family)|nr:type II toxin-antitoxin system HicA family toxin [Oscillospiraceae bacterium]
MGYSISYRRLEKFLKLKGFSHIRTDGSHRMFSNGYLTVPVPFHAGRDLKLGTIRSVLRLAGLSLAEFNQWLGR